MAYTNGYSTVRCTCGDEFDTYAEYLTHAYSVHGTNAEDAKEG